jgi:GxxExxY protein
MENEKDKMIFPHEAYEIIGAAMEVHNTLGQGFLESVYQEALEIEMSKREIPFSSQTKIQIHYKDIPMEHYFVADFVCYDKIIVELKSVSAILPEHEAQIINYLRATGFKLGILLNFNEESLFFKRYPNIMAKANIRTNLQL